MIDRIKTLNIKKLLVYAAIATVIFSVGGYFYLTYNLPTIDSLDDYHPDLVTKVYSHDGRVVAEFFTERRIVAPLNKMPKHLINAFLAAEDSKFYEHEGLNYMSILRAAYKNMLAGRVVQGGSTITQQVARSFFLTQERKISRKIREAIMAYRIERRLTKDEILNLYLNQIYLGNGAYGVQTASETYFGKNVQDLNLAEAAMLAALPKAPSKYSPLVNFEVAKKRQEFVLSRMVEENSITPEEAKKAGAVKLRLNPDKNDSLWVGPYFTEHVRRYIEEKYGEDMVYKGGLSVYTTMDVEEQRAANEAVKEGLREHDKRRGYRGPLLTLRTNEELNLFKAEAARTLDGAPFEVGRRYQGVIEAVNTKDMTITVDIGSRKGVIARPDLEWAKLYNPTGDPEGGVQQDLKKTFHAGEVVLAAVKTLPDKPGDTVKLALEQDPVAQAALFAIEPATGYVRVMIGGGDFSKTQFNRAVQALRQPGSAFKPFIYTAAIDKNYTPASVVVDSPLVFDNETDNTIKEGEEKVEAWRPKNYDEQFAGPTTVREGLAKSRNVVTVKILQDIGVSYAVNYARLLGITSPLANDLSLALGSSAVTLQEMVTAFATLENQGGRPAPIFVTKIVDSSGRTIEENMPIVTPVLSPQTSYIMTNLLQGVIENGTGMRAKSLGRPAAGKTGTTNDLNDAWFIGYVPGLAAGSWIGYDDERRLGAHETGAVAALPIWLKFMKEAVADMPVRNFPVPEGVEFVKVDSKTGEPAIAATPETIFEVFKSGTGPKASSAVLKRRSTEVFMDDSDAKQAPTPVPAPQPAQATH
ncbi:MAG: PBP1A family penicillin-binding protein [Deltaproteobacteria bacterium]|nr:PBP1A family penicillin-binding protein [Deltaproteobacteria bacterium]